MQKHHYPQCSRAACVAERTAQGVGVRRCTALQQHQYQLSAANQPKPGGRSKTPTVLSSLCGAGASERRDGGPEGEPGPEEQVSVMGTAVSGRSYTKKGGGAVAG